MSNADKKTILRLNRVNDELHMSRRAIADAIFYLSKPKPKCGKAKMLTRRAVSIVQSAMENIPSEHRSHCSTVAHMLDHALYSIKDKMIPESLFYLQRADLLARKIFEAPKV